VHHMKEIDGIMVLEMYITKLMKLWFSKCICVIYDFMRLCIVVFVHHIVYVACALCEHRMMVSS
jgi:hypothetical protein